MARSKSEKVIRLRREEMEEMEEMEMEEMEGMEDRLHREDNSDCCHFSSAKEASVQNQSEKVNARSSWVEGFRSLNDTKDASALPTSKAQRELFPVQGVRRAEPGADVLSDGFDLAFDTLREGEPVERRYRRSNLGNTYSFEDRDRSTVNVNADERSQVGTQRSQEILGDQLGNEIREPLASRCFPGSLSDLSAIPAGTTIPTDTIHSNFGQWMATTAAAIAATAATATSPDSFGTSWEGLPARDADVPIEGWMQSLEDPGQLHSDRIGWSYSPHRSDEKHAHSTKKSPSPKQTVSKTGVANVGSAGKGSAVERVAMNLSAQPPQQRAKTSRIPRSPVTSSRNPRSPKSPGTTSASSVKSAKTGPASSSTPTTPMPTQLTTTTTSTRQRPTSSPKLGRELGLGGRNARITARITYNSPAGSPQAGSPQDGREAREANEKHDASEVNKADGADGAHGAGSQISSGPGRVGHVGHVGYVGHGEQSCDGSGASLEDCADCVEIALLDGSEREQADLTKKKARNPGAKAMHAGASNTESSSGDEDTSQTSCAKPGKSGKKSPANRPGENVSDDEGAMSSLSIKPGKGGRGKGKGPHSKGSTQPGETTETAETAETSPEKAKGKGKLPPPAAPSSLRQKGEGEKGKAKGKTEGKEEEVKVLMRKPEVIPGVQVKRLFWNPIHLRANHGSYTVWDAIDGEGYPIDLQELEWLFSEAGKSPRGKTEPDRGEAGKRVIRVLDEQRRRQVCIMLARLPGSGQDVLTWITEINSARLGKDEVELLLHNSPSPEEAQLLRRAQEENVIDENNIWDTAEDFLLSLIAIPRFQLRLKIWDFVNSFEEKFEHVASDVNGISKGCDCLLTSMRMRPLRYGLCEQHARPPA